MSPFCNVARETTVQPTRLGSPAPLHCLATIVLGSADGGLGHPDPWDVICLSVNVPHREFRARRLFAGLLGYVGLGTSNVRLGGRGPTDIKGTVLFLAGQIEYLWGF